VGSTVRLLVAMNLILSKYGINVLTAIIIANTNFRGCFTNLLAAEEVMYSSPLAPKKSRVNVMY
jgi:hypothetical protein